MIFQFYEKMYTSKRQSDKENKKIYFYKRVIKQLGYYTIHLLRHVLFIQSI